MMARRQHQPQQSSIDYDGAGGGGAAVAAAIHSVTIGNKKHEHMSHNS